MAAGALAPYVVESTAMVLIMEGKRVLVIDD